MYSYYIDFFNLITKNQKNLTLYKQNQASDWPKCQKIEVSTGSATNAVKESRKSQTNQNNPCLTQL